jgi:general secretion pathway protein M
MIEALRAKWTALAQRERLIVVGVALLVVAALLYLGAVDPALTARRASAKDLPRLREQAAELQSLIQEVKLLRGRGAASYTPQAAKEALAQSLAQGNLASARIAMLDERRISVTAKAVPVAQWLVWVEQAARESRLRITTAQITATATRGMVDSEMTFEIARRP